MRCGSCREEILQKDPQKCPYCGSDEVIKDKSAAEILDEINRQE